MSARKSSRRGKDTRRGKKAKSPLKSYDSAKRWKTGGQGLRPMSSAAGGERIKRNKDIFTGRRKRQAARTRRRLLLTLLLIAVVVALAVWWWMSRPAEAQVTLYPEDAAISFLDHEWRGSVATSGIEPGTYRLTADRPGFEPLDTRITLERGEHRELSFSLEPRAIPVTLTAHPSEGTFSLTASDGETRQGALPFSGELPAGPLELRLVAPGHDPYTGSFFLDSPTTVERRLDPEGQLVSCEWVAGCGPAPKGVAISPDGAEVWTSLLGGPPSVQVLDAATGEVLDDVTLGEDGAVEVLFSPDGERVYASQMETARVYEIDAATREILRTFETESAWSKVIELSADGGRLFVANWSGDDVSEIDLATGELVRRIPVMDTPRGLWASPNGDTLWVAGFGGGELARVDLESGTMTEVFDSDGALRHIVGDDERGVLFVSDMAADCVWRVDTAGGSTERFVETDQKPNTIDLSPDGRVLLVSCRGENDPQSYYLPGPEWGSVLLFDALTGEPLDAVVGGNQPTALDVSDDGDRFVFSDFLDDTLRMYELPPHEELTAGDGGLFGPHREAMRK